MRTVIVTLMLALTLGGCRRGHKDAEAPTASGEPKGAMGKLFGRDVGPQYTWDGQYSKFSVSTPGETVFARATEVLAALHFTLDPDETGRTARGGYLQGQRPDKTVAQVIIEQKTPATTEISVKVGTVGERTGSERILDELQKALATPFRPTRGAQ